jgi:hypothetical protein
MRLIRSRAQRASDVATQLYFDAHCDDPVEHGSADIGDDALADPGDEATNGW